jgi:glucose-6-phosphate 1-epimerase
MQTLDQLTESFAIPGILAFDNTNGLIRARITTPACTAELYLHGAHVATWQPAGQQPGLFLSGKSLFAPDKAIRGGIPLVFPWFGPYEQRGPQTAAIPESPRTGGPVHGFARTEIWTLDFCAYSNGELDLTLSLAPSDLSRSFGYDHFLAAYHITVGRELHVRLSVANNGDSPFHFAEAFHTYLHVGDVEQVSLRGLANTEFLDKTDDFRRKLQSGDALAFHSLTDRAYLNTTSPLTVDDPVLHRRITVAKANSNTTVVWNPWANSGLADMSPIDWRSMLCVESANAIENAITLRPHEAHVMETTFSLESL